MDIEKIVGIILIIVGIVLFIIGDMTLGSLTISVILIVIGISAIISSPKKEKK